MTIPENERTPITSITIFTDPNSQISSVRLNEKHPNADENGWFCLGKLKRSKITVDNINRLIELIKCYKLDDCYWRPKGYKKWE